VPLPETCERDVFQGDLSIMGTKGTALITGASSGIGTVYADRLAKRGYEIVMSAGDMVDAALAGLDQGEIVTIPSLPDEAEWGQFDAARRAMSGRLSSALPTARYGVKHPQSGGE
jgi:short-subunit dehydrogenase